jgi:hypothetical protein
MSVAEALNIWSQLLVPQRKELIVKVDGNADEAENDWAALSPQLKTALVNALFPPSEQPAAEQEHDEEHEEKDEEKEDDDKPHRRPRRR